MITGIGNAVQAMGDKLDIPLDTAFVIEDISFKVKFIIDGEEKYVSVPREIDGEVIDEIFVVDMTLDSEGEIVDAVDNEDKSEYDGYTLAQALGKEYVYEGIVSAYDDNELMKIEQLGTDTDVKAVKYRLVDNPEIEILQHYKGELLVAEYTYSPLNGELPPDLQKKLAEGGA